ncbi:TIGR03085 family metal-binding protein [Cellulomonas sp. 179-A 4D5 NHS]|uniref:TIGR03085 family metal-binding protein n=1 Tax=Cellulomonas sp. 179-A 4D5 NHS TaxID=3142378 RepID=UPI0039A06A28
MTWHTLERRELAQALTDAGPEAPTLCEGWQARHLAAHVVLREGSLVVPAGLAVPPLAGRAERAIEDLAQAGLSEGGFRDLVARVAAEPPAWHPMTWAGDAANLVEFFVHTEDVRRGSGTVTDRELEPEREQALWAQLLRAARLTYRKVAAGVVLVRPDGVRRVVRRPARGFGTVVVRGSVADLLLHGFGRGTATQVTVEGAAQDVEAVREALPFR